MKKILTGILVGILCISLAACGNKNQTVTYIDDIMSYDTWDYLLPNFLTLSPSKLEEIYLTKNNTFIIKITVGERWKNVLNYITVEDYYIESVGHYDKEKHGHEPEELIIDKNNSYLLTPVTVDGIYYLGDDVKMKTGKDIELKIPSCYLKSSTSALKKDQDGKNSILYTVGSTYMLEPGEEYVILGAKEDGVYYINNIHMYEFKTDKTKPEGYYDSENAQQVIDDFFDFYKEQVKDFTFN